MRGPGYAIFPYSPERIGSRSRPSLPRAGGVEMDRCAADAIAVVTGVKLGRRSLKFMDYGIMAATFVNLETDNAFRVISTEEARELASVYAPEIEGKSKQQLEAYIRMPDSVLFRVQKVRVNIREYDLPGPTRRKSVCYRCGQMIRDHREVAQGDQLLCKPCTDDCYFSDCVEVCWSDMDWSPQLEQNPLKGNRNQEKSVMLHLH